MQPRAHFEHGFGPVARMQGRLAILSGPRDRDLAGHGPSHQVASFQCYFYTGLV